MSYFSSENSTYMPYYPTNNKMDYYDDTIYHHPHVPAFNYESVVPVLAQPMVPSHVEMYPSSSPPPMMSSTPGLITPPPFMPSSPLAHTNSSCSSHTSSLLPSPVSSPSLPSNSALTEKINKRLALANPLPDAFLPEFHQYSKETYEDGSSSKKKKRNYKHQRRDSSISTKEEEEEEGEEVIVSSAELRRQVHIQSEQKRRAQIRDGFDVLRQQLPGIGHKKMSKASLLHKTVQHLSYMKKQQDVLLVELEKLLQENEHLKRQQGLLV
ncbi:hypothetical protein K501DRAFT_206544 [Backusella circina FSU 941]|nr:hypothetical protein K501DRAFT_206544 [Backusella circina FSU 941]